MWRPVGESASFPSAEVLEALGNTAEKFLPLPQIGDEGPSRSRSSRLRSCRASRRALAKTANDLIAVVNALFGSLRPQSQTSREQLPTERLRMAWSCCQQRLLQDAKRLQVARRKHASTGVLAVASLLRLFAGGAYSVSTLSPHVELVADAVDEPSSEQVVPLLEALPPCEARFYAEEANLLDKVGKSTAVFEELEQRYGFVSGTEQSYADYFLREDLPKNMWSWGTAADVKAIMGFSTVGKKDGKKQRKILMGCATNYLWTDVRRRASLGMGGGGALTQMMFEDPWWQVAAFDESNAFSYVLVPTWMWGWQAVPPVRAQLVWKKLPSELRAKVSYASWVYPLYMRLPMGLSHSVHLLMQINMAAIGRAIRAATCLKELDPVDMVLADLEDDDEHWEPHRDDEEACAHLEDRRRNKRSTGKFTPKQWAEACRRVRRLHFRVFTFVHVFGGRERPETIQHYMDKLAAEYGVVVLTLSVDLAVDGNWDLSWPPTAELMQDTADQGLVDGAAGGPPCSTVSRARFNRRCPGPRPVRTRGLYVWGLPHLTAHERKRVSEANILWLNTLAYFESISLQQGVHLLEHPADPGQPPYPSFWDTDVTKGMEERSGAERRLLDQCPFGGCTKKATIMSTTLPGSEVLERYCPGLSPTHQHGKSEGVDEHGNFHTRKLEAYPPELCLTIAKLFLGAFAQMLAAGSGPGGATRPFPRRPLVSRWSVEATSMRPGVSVLNEAYVDGKPVSVDGSRSACYLHVDDGLFFSTVQGKAPAGDLMKGCLLYTSPSPRD